MLLKIQGYFVENLLGNSFSWWCLTDLKRGIPQSGCSSLTPALYNTPSSPVPPPDSYSLPFLMLVKALMVPFEADLSAIFPASPPHGTLLTLDRRVQKGLYICTCCLLKCSFWQQELHTCEKCKGGISKKGLMGFKSLTLKDSDAQLEFWNYFISCSQNPCLKDQINLEFLKKKKRKNSQKIF